MNKEDYVSLEVAKLLKGKGFDEPCYKMYNEEEDCYNYSCYTISKKGFRSSDLCDYEVTVPILYEAQKWIWQSNKLLVTAFIKAPFGQPHEFIYCIQDAKNTIDDYGTIVSEKSYNSIQEALNAGIFEALKLI